MKVAHEFLNVLIQLAEADKHFATVEREMIFRIARAKGVPDEEVRHLIKFPYPIELNNLTHDQKVEYLISSVELVLVDNRIFDAEILFCKKIAWKLGIDEGVIDTLLDTSQRNAKVTIEDRLM